MVIRFTLLFLFVINLNAAFAQNSTKRGLRGAWLTTFSNIDWPVRTQSVAQQKSALINILNHHQATGINVIYLQVRSQCDALYASTIEPWSADLTGTQGLAPSPFWDPLQFAIEECKKRGIELHAWLNPYRAISNVASINTFAASHVARRHPEWLLQAGNLRTLDPGLPEVRTYINTVISDIVNRYDIDGIHFDDYFYPNATFNDDVTFQNHARGFTNRDDWRRDNVNLLIQGVYQLINAAKPWVKFGVSPSGIYRNSTNPDIGTPTSGLQHYSQLYADSKKWIAEGWVDYLTPQVYWYIGQPGADYSRIVPWWNNNAAGRHIYIGMAGYKVNDATQGTNWTQRTEIPNQIRLNRSFANVYGEVFYNTNSLLSTTRLNFRDSLRLRFYNTKALLPLMPWKDNVAPQAVANLEGAKFGADSLVLNWSLPNQNSLGEFDKVKQIVVYRSLSTTIDLTNAANILAIVPAGVGRFADKTIGSGNYHYQVTALDRFHNESVGSNIVSTLTTSLPGEQEINHQVVKIYPNPVTQNQVHLVFPDAYKEDEITVSIADLTGRKVFEEFLSTRRQSSFLLNVNLQSGLYILYIQGKGLIERSKIIIQ
ncbi:glycoside hydrolase family 10 protein [Pedobacter glucosidilyticus]|uniref:glycoside hydrolase family 10 protein n=1 Tax=Pedobacter glucosidilyticus TaxID=1122941 RepID=UPI0026EB6E55|nr:family 10 glycosylhydrolase [Pedobacter glucosidilyticus]